MEKIYDSLEGYIYRIKFNCPGDKHDGEYYYGCTLSLRKRKNKFNCMTHPYCGAKFEELRQKHGTSCFLFELVEVITEFNITKKDMIKKLEAREGFWILKSDSVEKGLNSNYGGGGRLGMAMPNEVKEKISQTMTGIKRGEETKQKMSNAKKKRIRAIMSDGSEQEYPSIGAAASANNLSISAVSMAYRLNRKCRSGVTFVRA